MIQGWLLILLISNYVTSVVVVDLFDSGLMSTALPFVIRKSSLSMLF